MIPPIKGIDLKGIHVLKKVPDADEIIALLDNSVSHKAVIVGAGLIGMEMAEAWFQWLRSYHCRSAGRLLAALADDEITDLVAKHVKSKGVTLKLGQKIMAFEGDGGKVQLADYR